MYINELAQSLPAEIQENENLVWLVLILDLNCVSPECNQVCYCCIIPFRI